MNIQNPVSESDQKLTELTSEVVAAYVSKNPIPASELPQLIASVFDAIGKLQNGEPQKEEPVPAVDPKKSVKADHIVCLECGKKFKSIKRHLMSSHEMTPEEYREKWNLSVDYPTTAPNYANTRSQLAKEMGLGRKPGEKPGSRKKK